MKACLARPRNPLICMVRPVGLEPTPQRSKVIRSAANQDGLRLRFELCDCCRLKGGCSSACARQLPSCALQGRGAPRPGKRDCSRRQRGRLEGTAVIGGKACTATPACRSANATMWSWCVNRITCVVCPSSANSVIAVAARTSSKCTSKSSAMNGSRFRLCGHRASTAATRSARIEAGRAHPRSTPPPDIPCLCRGSQAAPCGRQCHNHIDQALA